MNEFVADGLHLQRVLGHAPAPVEHRVFAQLGRGDDTTKGIAEKIDYGWHSVRSALWNLKEAGLVEIAGSRQDVPRMRSARLWRRVAQQAVA